MTTEEQQLVERLRARRESVWDGQSQDYGWMDDFLCHEAADTITRLVEERDRWEAACDGNTALGAEIAETLKSRIDMLEAERDAGRSVYLTLQQSAAVVVKKLAASDAKVAELQEALKDILTACECPYPINHRDAIDCHKAGECGCVYGGGARALEASK